jgi:hypothetical protein
VIIYGWRGITSTKEQGDFFCPACGGEQRPYKLKSVRRFFTLYFIPVIPLDHLGKYVECGGCKNSFDETILEFDPVEFEQKLAAELVEHAKRVMILTALADGEVDDEEIDRICEHFEELSGNPLSEETLHREIDQAQRASVTPASYIGRYVPQLTVEGRETIMRAAIRVVSAFDYPGDAHQEALDNLSKALGMSQAHYQGLLAELDEE